MNIINNGLDIEREIREQDGTEYQFGATSQAGLAIIPEVERLSYLPLGEQQFGAEDFMDCASRGPINNLETQFTYLYQNNKFQPENKLWLETNGYVEGNRVVFSDRFIAVKSNTTRDGNSIKAPIDAIHNYGLIPKKMLPKVEGMTFNEYHDKTQITSELVILGLEFLKRFSINYEQVQESHYEMLFEKDMLVQAGYAWTIPINGVYPSPDNENPNHVWLGVKKPKYVIFDNYLDTDGDYIKVLAPDYNMFDYGYRVFISAENVPNLEKKSFLDQLVDIVRQLLNIQKQVDALPKPPLQETYPTPLMPSKSDKLYDISKSLLGKHLTLDNTVPKSLGCAEAVSYVLMSVGYIMPAKGIPGTYTLYEWFKKHFEEIPQAEKGCVVISPTTTKIGHVGICGVFNYMYPNDFAVMSNSSDTGIYDTQWRLNNWKAYYHDKLGLDVFFFRPK